MRIRTILAAATSLLAVATPAQAASIIGTINFTGSARIIGPTNNASSATGLDFVDIANPGTTGPGVAGILSTMNGTGIFAGIVCTSACGTIKDLPTFIAVPITGFLQFGGGYSFDLVSIDAITRTPGAKTGGSLTLDGTGVFRKPGLVDTVATLSLTTQGRSVTTFSASALSAVPEPASWAMMIAGFGLMGGLLRVSRGAVRVRYASR